MLPVTCSQKFTLLVHIAAGDRNVSNSNSSIEKNIRNDLPTKKEKHYLLVVMVLSVTSEKGKIWRQVIRETWKNEVEAVKSEVFSNLCWELSALHKVSYCHLNQSKRIIVTSYCWEVSKMTTII